MGVEDKPGKIYELMSKVMASIGAIAKKQKNTHSHYNFRGIDDVLNALSPALVEHGVFCVPELVGDIEQLTERPTQKGGLQLHTRLKVRYTFYAPDGSSVAALAPGEAMDVGDKSVNQAMSAAYKYMAFQTFCIATEEQTDADSKTPEVAAGKPHGTTPAKSNGRRSTSTADLERREAQAREAKPAPKHDDALTSYAPSIFGHLEPGKELQQAEEAARRFKSRGMNDDDVRLWCKEMYGVDSWAKANEACRREMLLELRGAVTS